MSENASSSGPYQEVNKTDSAVLNVIVIVRLKCCLCNNTINKEANRQPVGHLVAKFEKECQRKSVLSVGVQDVENDWI